MRTCDPPPNVVPRREPIDLAPLNLPHPAPFLCDVQVAEGDLSGVIEHVSNIQYVRWLDRAAELHTDSLGFTRRWLVEHDLMWFVARHEIDYLGETWRDDRLVLATWVRDCRRVRAWREYALWRPLDGRILCRAATLWVLVDLRTRRPRSVPADMVGRLEPLVSGERGPSKAHRPCMSS
jgi:acyl-CoA thioester hydrolase